MKHYAYRHIQILIISNCNVRDTLNISNLIVKQYYKLLYIHTPSNSLMYIKHTIFEELIQYARLTLRNRWFSTFANTLDRAVQACSEICVSYKLSKHLSGTTTSVATARSLLTIITVYRIY